MAAEGKLHMFVANFLYHCGLSSWQVNSEISHAVSNSVEEPFVLVDPDDKPVLNYFSHNPTTVHGPTTDGYYVVYHVGTGSQSSHGPPIHCNESGSDGPVHSVRKQLEPEFVDPPAQITVETLYSKTMAGPWTKLAVSGSMCPNPGAWLFKNGSVLLACKIAIDAAANKQMVMYTAPSWRGPFKLAQITPVFGEDQHIWQDPRGHFHMLLHSLLPHKVGTTAWSPDGLHWTPNGFAGPPNPNPRESIPRFINLAGGGVKTLSRRERHQLLFNSQGWPIALYNGVTSLNDARPDRSWTSVQPIHA